tara:strand:- start:150 stop:272 length:123 start_codon:yes stop_codon:yes gene_type:complete
MNPHLTEYEKNEITYLVKLVGTRITNKIINRGIAGGQNRL